MATIIDHFDHRWQLAARIQRRQNNESFREEFTHSVKEPTVARGDHLYYYRAGGAYSHHGIDCGDGSVVHFESSLWMKLAGTLRSKRTPRIRRTSMAEFAQGSQVKTREHNRADDVESVIRRAESRIDEEGYDVFGNNCEHFAVWCKTGIALSSQIRAHEMAMDSVRKMASLTAILTPYARRIPGGYRRTLAAGAMAVTGAVYARSYLLERYRNIENGES